jgi:hypothetical protein
MKTGAGEERGLVQKESLGPIEKYIFRTYVSILQNGKCRHNVRIYSENILNMKSKKQPDFSPLTQRWGPKRPQIAVALNGP